MFVHQLFCGVDEALGPSRDGNRALGETSLRYIRTGHVGTLAHSIAV